MLSFKTAEWLQSFNKHHLLTLTDKGGRDHTFSLEKPKGLKTIRCANVIKCTGRVCFSEEIFGVSVHKKEGLNGVVASTVIG